MVVFLAILIIILILGADFAFSSFVVWLGSLIFPYDFSWVLALFVWLVLIVLQGVFKQKVS